MVYKLVAVEDERGELVSVAKRSLGKGTVGGRKAAFRLLDDDGHLDHDELVPDNTVPIDRIPGPGRRLQVPLITDGAVVGQPSLDASRAWSEQCRDELPPLARCPDPEVRFETLVVERTPATRSATTRPGAPTPPAAPVVAP